MKKLLPIILILLVMGCASKVMVYESQTGLPARNYELIISNPSNNIKTSFHIVQMLEVSQESSIPVYLNLYEKYSLDGEKTKRVEMVLRVLNPKKEKFRIFKEVKYREAFGWDYEESVQNIFVGDDTDKTFQLVCPTNKKGNYLITVIVYSEEGIPLAMYNDFKYSVK